jgi:hypothetical protein
MDINASVEIWRFFNKYSLSLLTGVNDNQVFSQSVSIYPNPANSVLNIKSEYESIFSVEITDVLGKIVLAEKTTHHSIPLEHLNTGIYFVTVTNESGAAANMKFIKE